MRLISAIILTLALTSAVETKADGIISLPCDTTVIDSLVAGSDTDSLSFSVSDDERLDLYIEKISGIDFSGIWRLLDGQGGTVIGNTLIGNGGIWVLNPLSSAGNPYLIEIFDSDGVLTEPGTYGIHLQRITASTACENIALLCDSTMTGVIENGLDTDLLSFSVSDGERLGLYLETISGAGYAGTWRLVDSLGDNVIGFTAVGNGGVWDLGPLSSAGNPYRVEILDSDGVVSEPGTYGIHLQRLPASTACEGIPIPCDSTITGVIENGLDTDLLSFDVSEGERLDVYLETISGAGFAGMWRLLDGLGTIVMAFTPVGNGGVWNLGPLSSAGNPYRIEIADSDGLITEPGVYGIHLQRLTALAACEDILVPCDSTITGVIENGLDTDLLSFSVSDGEQLGLYLETISGADFAGRWRLIDGQGTAVVGFTDIGNGGEWLLGPLFSSGNPYRVELLDRDGFVSEPGVYAIHLQRLTALAACEDIPIPCDSTITGVIENGLDTDLLSFSVSDGEQLGLYLETISGVDFAGRWRLIDGQGTAVVGFTDIGSGGEWLLGPLFSSGNPYRVELLDRDGFVSESGVYGVHLQRFTALAACEDIPIPCDSTITGVIENGLDTDLLSFSVSDGEQLGLYLETISGVDFAGRWRLIDGQGTAVVGFTDIGSGGEWLLGPLFSSGNPYRVELLDRDGFVSEPGVYAIHLQRLTETAACEDIPIPCDSTITGVIENGLDTDLLSFSVSDGEQLGLYLETISGVDFAGRWRLIDGQGTAVVGFTDIGSGGEWLLGPLFSSGNPYRVELLDRDGFVSEPGVYAIHLQRLTALAACEDILVPCDSTITGVIENGLDTDLLSFSVSDGEQLGLYLETISGVDFAGRWRLIDGQGTAVVGFTDIGSGGEWLLGPLFSSGNPYRVELLDRDGFVSEPGVYAIHLQRLTALAACEDIPIPCDSTITGVIENGLDTDLLSFNVSDGERLDLYLERISGNGFAGRWRLVDGQGASVIGFTSIGNGGLWDVGPLSSADNPYRIEILDSDGVISEPGVYAVHLQRLTASATCESIELVCDSTITGSIENGLDTDLLVFEVSEGERVDIFFETKSGADFSGLWRLLDGEGRVVTSFVGNGFWDRGPLFPAGKPDPLVAAGNPYRVEVIDSDGVVTEPGSYQIHLQRLNADVACEDILLPCVATQRTIDGPTDTDLFSFTVSEGMTVDVTFETVAGPGFSGRWRLLDGQGSVVTSWVGDGVYTRGPLFAEGNPYRIEVIDSNGVLPGTGAYSILVSACDSTTSTGETPDWLPTRFALAQNYPNPFNPRTTIQFDLPQPGHVRLRVFDLAGNLVSALVEAKTTAGRHRVEWDASRLASGVYIYRLQTDGFTSSRKLVVLK